MSRCVVFGKPMPRLFDNALALLRYKIGVIPVIAACALAGLAVRFTGWI